jgi:hypothetical protein
VLRPKRPEPPSVSHKLVFTAQPTSTIAAQSINPVRVAIVDQLGNVHTAENRTIRLAIRGDISQENLPDLTAQAINGVATFSQLALTKAGTYRLEANADNLLGTSSETFEITCGPPRRLAFEAQPTDIMAGQRLSPLRINVTDAFDNPVVNAKIAISLLSKHSGAKFTGDWTAPTIGGVATFSNLLIETAGSDYTLKAFHDSGLDACSKPFKVKHGPAERLRVESASSAFAAESMNSVQVSAVDRCGNSVTSFTSEVTLSIAKKSGEKPRKEICKAEKGVATFSNLSISDPGMYTLTASDGRFTSAPAIVNIERAPTFELDIKPADNKLAQGKKIGATVSALRKGYTGPIQIAVKLGKDPPVTGTIPADSNEVTFQLSAKPDAAIGKADIVATGTRGDSKKSVDSPRRTIEIVSLFTFRVENLRLDWCGEKEKLEVVVQRSKQCKEPILVKLSGLGQVQVDRMQCKLAPNENKLTLYFTAPKTCRCDNQEITILGKAWPIGTECKETFTLTVALPWPPLLLTQKLDGRVAYLKGLLKAASSRNATEATAQKASRSFQELKEHIEKTYPVTDRKARDATFFLSNTLPQYLTEMRRQK